MSTYFEIVFNEISAAEMSRLDTLTQLDVLTEFRVTTSIVKDPAGLFGKVGREGGKTLYRFRAGEWRIYFEVVEDKVVVHRVLPQNTLEDFLFRSNLPGSHEDEALAKSKHFWKLIDEGAAAGKKTFKPL